LSRRRCSRSSFLRGGLQPRRHRGLDPPRRFAAVGDNGILRRRLRRLLSPLGGAATASPRSSPRLCSRSSWKAPAIGRRSTGCAATLRWKVACGLHPTREGFHPTVLVYFRERFRTSSDPRRILDRFMLVAAEAGLRMTRGIRVLDSTLVLSALATQDTVSMIRGGIRRLLDLIASADRDQAAALRPRRYE
jgi:hypothetical protein